MTLTKIVASSIKLRVSFFPKKLYQWTLLFYVSVPFFVVLMFMVLPILNALIELIGVKIETRVILITVLFFHSVVFLWQTSFQLFSVFKKKIPITLNSCLLNTGLFVITIPIVVAYILSGISVTLTYVEPVITNIWLDSIYKRVAYQKLDQFPSMHWAGYSLNNSVDDTAIAITTQQEYQGVKAKSAEAFTRFRSPTIDFTHYQLLISVIFHRNCETIQRRVYQDDKNKRILHITTIRPIWLDACYKGKWNTEAGVIPKKPGYTIKFLVHRV